MNTELKRRRHTKDFAALAMTAAFLLSLPGIETAQAASPAAAQAASKAAVPAASPAVQAASKAAVPAASPAAQAASKAAAPLATGRELRVGVFLDSDSLPLLVADAQGLFAKEGVRVSLVPFQNPVERDAALQAGAVDGAVSDLLAAALAVQAGFELRVTSLTDGRYGLVSAPGSGITKLAELKGVEVGTSLNSIVHYATETLLKGAGLAPADIRVIAVPKMPVRLELLLAGQIKAACLPEPLLSAARARGATLLAASDDAGLGAGVILFTKKVLDEAGGEVAAFYRGYEAACAAINADNDGYRPFLAQKANFPAEVAAGYRFVSYKKPRLPTEADIGSALAWLSSKGLLKKALSPSALLDARGLAGR
jgi:NitT/TauT family transport system substrate-binding protein